MPALGAGLGAEIERAKEAGLYRSLRLIQSRSTGRLRVDGRSVSDFSSNDYLGLSTHPAVKKAAARAAMKWGAGSGASRLLSGNLQVHADLESALARFKKEEAAAVFSSGYLANLAAVTALADERDVVLVDRLNHASLIDAARLSRAKLWPYAHLDVSALSKLLDRAGAFRRRLVVTDTYFSMDGHVAPLADLAALCASKDAILMVDEAHATGVYGERGSGLVEASGLTKRIGVVAGTLSKALGSVGGFVAGSALLKETLIQRARPFIYTTAPSPAASAAAQAAISLVEKGKALRRRLWENSRLLREALRSHGFDLLRSEGPIIPVLAGDPARALAWRDALLKEGFFVPAIRPPSVPKGTDRLRISVSAAHTPAEIKRLARAFGKLDR